MEIKERCVCGTRKIITSRQAGCWVCSGSLLLSCSTSTRSVCREARGLQARTPLLPHWQKNKNSTFSPLSSEEQVVSERFLTGIKIRVLNLGKCEIVPETGNTSGRSLESFRQNISNLSEAESFHSDAPPFFPREENDPWQLSAPPSPHLPCGL